MTFSGAQLLDFVKKMTLDPDASKNVKFFSINNGSEDGLMLFLNRGERALLVEAVSAVQTKTILQSAKTPEEIDLALSKILQDNCIYFCAKYDLNNDGQFEFQGHEVEGETVLIFYTARDLAMLANLKEEKNLEIFLTNGKSLREVCKNIPVAIGYEILEDGRMGSVRLTKERLEKIELLEKERKD
jgi:hypothetical protein